MEIDVVPPSLNASEVEFAPRGAAIHYALAALKNMGQQAAEHICEERSEHGPYKDIGDVARRLNPKCINKRALETLAAAGAFDAFGIDRGVVHANADLVLAAANRSAGDRVSGQNDLFGGGDAPASLDLPPTHHWPPIERLANEFDAVGFFLSGHPLDEYDSVLERLKVETWSEFAAKTRAGRSAGTLAGTVTYRQDRKSKSGNSFAFAGFSDRTGQYEAIVFSDVLATARDVLEPGTPVLVKVEAELEEDAIKVRLQSVQALDAVAGRIQNGLRVVVADVATLDDVRARLSPQGEGTLRLVLRLPELERDVEFTLPGGFDTSPAQAGILRATAGVAAVEAL